MNGWRPVALAVISMAALAWTDTATAQVEGRSIGPAQDLSVLETQRGFPVIPGLRPDQEGLPGDFEPQFNPFRSPIPNLFGGQDPLRNFGDDQLPGNPRLAESDIGSRIVRATSVCGSDPKRCDELRGLRIIQASLIGARRTAPDCDAAVSAYRPLGEAASDSVAARYDLNCLGSLVPRLGDSVPILSRTGPSIVSDPRALRSIGLLMTGGEPFCGALIRSDRTLVTAQHCFRGPGRSALRAGAVTVQPLDGSGPWRVGSILRQGQDTEMVGDDWSIAQIETSETIDVVDSVFKPMTIPTEATVIAYFRQHGAVRSFGDDGEPNWRRGVRWPRQGLCPAVVDRSGCLQLHCQTVPGFSGAPIFREPTNGDPIEVLGFVSGAGEKPDIGCPVAPVGMTMAVSSGVVR